MHSIIRRVLLACTENIPYTAINVVICAGEFFFSYNGLICYILSSLRRY